MDSVNLGSVSNLVGDGYDFITPMHYGDEIVTAETMRNKSVTVSAGKKTTVDALVSSWNPPSNLIVPVNAQLMYYSGESNSYAIPSGLYATGVTIGWQVGYNWDFASLKCIIHIVNTSSTNVSGQLMSFYLRVTWRRCALDTRVHY